MRLHANAPLSPKGRQLLIDRIKQDSQTVCEVAESFGISERTARKWLARYRAEGPAGLVDRSSAPNVVANRTDEHTIEAIAALRRLRFTGTEIAAILGRPTSTVSGILTRIGMGRLGRLGMEPVVRYERATPGELIHIDVKKLGRIHGGAGKRITGRQRNPTQIRVDNNGVQRRITGWEAVHVAIDDATRLAYAEVLPNEKASTVTGFLRRAISFFERHGMTVRELLTDNGPAYRSKTHALACHMIGIRHRRTRPYRPQTNGKAERFIRTMLAGWAYGAIYATSAERTAALDGWIYRYNHHRPHSALGRQTPITRLNNLLGSYS
jgi:transposase InsO family protein